MPYTYDYPRPALTVDAVIFTHADGMLNVLLIQRDRPPFEGQWALPGGFVDNDETLEEAVERELREETGLTGIHLQQLYTFGAIGRDPRCRTVSVAYYGFADTNMKPTAGDDARKVQWFEITDIPSLAFDHDQILNMAIRRFAQKMN